MNTNDAGSGRQSQEVPSVTPSSGPDTQTSALTANQKKKRRQKLSKRFKRSQQEDAPAAVTRRPNPSTSLITFAKAQQIAQPERKRRKLLNHQAPLPGQQCPLCHTVKPLLDTATHSTAEVVELQADARVLGAIAAPTPAGTTEPLPDNWGCSAAALPTASALLSAQSQARWLASPGQPHQQRLLLPDRLCTQRLSGALAVPCVVAQQHSLQSSCATSRHNLSLAAALVCQSLVAVAHAQLLASVSQFKGSQLEQDSRQEVQVCRLDMSRVAVLVAAALLAANGPESNPGHKRLAPHGNYRRYYGYRLGCGEFERDPRLQVFERNWFRGQRCLDVGCNEGVVTLAIAAQLGCSSILGIDIDAALIARACAALSRERKAAAEEVTRLKRTDAEEQERRRAAGRLRSLKSVWFQQEDILGKSCSVEAGSVDTVTCLSVTKWVHLNAGDHGVQLLFQRLADALRPGGLLLLEPQPWKSYKQALRKQELAAARHSGVLAALQLHPEDFPAYLTTQLGFILLRDLEVPRSAAGFNRPIYLFQKHDHPRQ